MATGTGRITVAGLRLRGCHGVLPAEHSQPQPFLVDLELELDLGPAGAQDRLGLTIDYSKAATIAAEVVGGPHRDLIETLAVEIGERLLSAFGLLDSGVVVVHKPEAPLGLGFDDVAVRVPFARPHPDQA